MPLAPSAPPQLRKGRTEVRYPRPWRAQGPPRAQGAVRVERHDGGSPEGPAAHHGIITARRSQSVASEGMAAKETQIVGTAEHSAIVLMSGLANRAPKLCYRVACHGSCAAHVGRSQR